jgi:hypothetical protein
MLHNVEESIFFHLQHKYWLHRQVVQQLIHKRLSCMLNVMECILNDPLLLNWPLIQVIVLSQERDFLKQQNVKLVFVSLNTD